MQVSDKWRDCRHRCFSIEPEHLVLHIFICVCAFLKHTIRRAEQSDIQSFSTPRRSSAVKRCAHLKDIHYKWKCWDTLGAYWTGSGIISLFSHDDPAQVMVLSYCWWENWGHKALKSDTSPLSVTLKPLSHISCLLLLTVLRNDACFEANVSFSICERREKEVKLLFCTLNASH